MEGSAQKKRKVRKGTHSCWECRRRKIRCKFANEDDAVCINCETRGTSCVSQEFDHQRTTQPSSKNQNETSSERPSGGLEDRLHWLENMMNKIVQDQPKSGNGQNQASTALMAALPAILACRNKESELDLLDRSAVRNAQQVTINYTDTGDDESGMYPNRDKINLPTPEASESATSPSASATGPNSLPSFLARQSRAAPAPSRSSKYRQVSQDLLALFPCPTLRSILAYESPGARLVLGCFHTYADRTASRTEAPSVLADPAKPDASAHPALLAKRLLQYAICMQNLAPNFDVTRLKLKTTRPCEVISTWVGAAVALVTSNDDLVGCLEGLECLVLLAMFQGEAGHLRKAWMTGRRALNMGQVMGIDRPKPPPVRSVAGGDPSLRASVSVLWFRINCADRYHSLILGLPIGSRSNSFADPNIHPPAEPEGLDQLSKSYGVIAGRVADRNDILASSTQACPPVADEAYTLTQAIDLDLERSATAMPDDWWRVPDLVASLRAGPEVFLADCSAIRLHVRHSSLLVLLHLPYLLRARASTSGASGCCGGMGSRYEYNRFACMRASRTVLERFLVFRSVNIAYINGRHVDYAALVAAMTIMLGYVGHTSRDDAERHQDRAMIEKVLDTFKALAAIKGERLSAESVETIQALLPILDDNVRTATSGQNSRSVHLTVPFLGTVNINPQAAQDETSMEPTSSDLIASSAAAYAGVDLPGELTPTRPVASAHEPPFSLNFDPNIPPSHAPAGLDGAPLVDSSADGLHLDFPDDAGWPDFSAELDDWTFQGVDTTYWSMLNQSL